MEQCNNYVLLLSARNCTTITDNLGNLKTDARCTGHVIVAGPIPPGTLFLNWSTSSLEISTYIDGLILC